MKSTGSNLAGWCFHDFRRTVVSELAERGHSAIVLDALLNHAGAVGNPNFYSGNVNTRLHNGQVR